MTVGVKDSRLTRENTIIERVFKVLNMAGYS
jgi:hypothetical protein